MRITNAMMTNSYLKNLNMNLTSVDKYQTQVTTGKRITRISDDPVGVLTSLQTRSRISRTEQYKTNVETAGDWMTQSESSLIELNKILQTAYERAMQASTDVTDNSDRTAIAAEIREIRDQVLSVGNSKVSNKYVFGGYNTSSAPFTVDETTGTLKYNGLDVSIPSTALSDEAEQHIGFEIGFDMTIDVSTNGLELMGQGDSNIYNILDELQKTLQTGSTEDISAFIPRLQDAQQEVLAATSKIGGITNRLDLITNRYEEDQLNYSEMQSRVEDVDQADAITQYKTASAVYLFALQIGSNIVKPSLVDYLN